MIAYLRGRITFKSPTYIVVEAGGVGYGLHISLHTYAQLEKLEEAQVLTHLYIKEDSHTLYGFMEAAERHLFRLLISVSGVGPATAQVALSSMNPEEIRAAILSEQVGAFQAVKGVGPKTAKCIILDLKDKLIKAGGSEDASFVPAADNTLRQEALSALIALGFNRTQVQKALNRALKEDPSIRQVETLIKLVLKQLS
jgi:Holliday junction DNA helicase RuvA